MEWGTSFKDTDEPGASSLSGSYSRLNEWTRCESLRTWILDNMRLMQPSRVHLCDGSDEENEKLLQQMVHSGMLIKLNEKLRPNSYVARSTPGDVARVEERTFICSDTKEDAGPTNNWRDPEGMMEELRKLYSGCMRGRTMYVVPFCMGPLDSPFSKIGVQLTDSPYVVVNMRIMTRMGKPALEMLEKTGEFVPCVHSVGVPLERDQADTPWPCNEANKYIVHFPEQRRIWSFGSGYGGNALLGKKCFALRIASAMAREEGWLAEHMLIVGITNPQGVKKYFAAAFPSACGKTNFAMMLPSLPGWKVECVGDDIAWIRIGKDGRLWAVNPEAGFFGVAPGTSYKSNPNCMEALKENAIFTNVAITPEGDVWWEGMTDQAPPVVTNWLRVQRFSDSSQEAAHPNARFTVAAKQCPVMDAKWEDPEGVPLDAIIFGGRRSTTVPLVFQARDWTHGVFVGANINSETTAAAAGKRGVLRPDPFAMKPFCGYNMADYFAHWLTFTKRTDPNKLPKIFHVNWFRKSSSGKFLWPGFGENIRVVDWMFKRCEEPLNSAKYSVDTPIGWVPAKDAIDVKGLNLAPGAMDELLKVDPVEWRNEAQRTRAFFSTFGSRMPKELLAEVDKLEKRCAEACPH